MSLHPWMTFVLVAIGVSLIPGPAVVAVISSALRGGFRASLGANAGVLVGDAAFVSAMVAAADGGLRHRARTWLRGPRAVRVPSRVSGAAMLGVAARLATER